MTYSKLHLQAFRTHRDWYAHQIAALRAAAVEFSSGKFGVRELNGLSPSNSNAIIAEEYLMRADQLQKELVKVEIELKRVTSLI